LRDKKLYKIIYADPPWNYGNYANDVEPKARDGKYSKFKITPYASMDIEKIKSLPIEKMCEKNAVLFLWVTMPCLQWGLDVIKAWGFEYKTTAFVWVKRKKKSDGYFVGLGNYTRANAEICMLATRGQALKRISKKVLQICDMPVTDHSKKPHVIRDRIIQLFGDLPRVELFARTQVHGWDVWGNDEKLMIKPLEHYLKKKLVD